MIRALVKGSIVAILLAVLAGPAAAQSLSLDLGDGGGSTTGRIVELVALMTVLSVVPGLLVTVTSFTRIVVVLSFLRTAIGIQQTPPNTVLISLALFLSAFVMGPTLERSYNDGIAPLIAEKIDNQTAFDRTAKPFHDFMQTHVRDQDLQLFMGLGRIPAVATPDDTPFRALVPAFLISELRRAFEIGFLLFLPFLIIDIVVASLVMSMGMVSLPPNVISLPFKLIFFVLIDGWYLVCGSLIQSFGPG
ncbi:MAG TPA: flagellar type III secretion system pore protein FliP [Aliidongia sp.]|uniref:flagellar type III secretion system pore protein FliP n=1 Tax=Aliidongia sp. TaxID=1914230 RepID=UPI002DDD3FE6|nr:flagellar type III secretion system pore protein FliP [Aliidongia sp.]HEV2674088.1 flagellar type III secretion system pore protein FliP [Aliidongia sp.]